MKNDEELDFNKKNLLETKNIMDKATTIESDEWDRNNPIIKIILRVLFIFILLGLIYILVSYFMS